MQINLTHFRMERVVNWAVGGVLRTLERDAQASVIVEIHLVV